MSTLSEVLTELREEKGLSQSELAKQLGISRGYYSLLEGAGEREPSVEFLRKLSGILVGRYLDSPEEYNAAIRLGLAILNHEFVDPHATLIGSVPEEIGIQADKRLETVWIISEIIGETLSEPLLRQTVANLLRENPVRYTFFVPHDRNPWTACLDLIKSTLIDQEKDPSILEDGRLIAVACPPMTCFFPIRILTLSTSERFGTITLGDPTTVPRSTPTNEATGEQPKARPASKKRPLLYGLEPEKVSRIVSELSLALSNLRRRTSWESGHPAYTRLYPQEPSSNE